MHVLTDIPFTLDSDQIRKRLRIRARSEDAEALDGFVRLAQAIGRPKAAYREAYIAAKGADTVRVEDVTFTSTALRRNVDAVERVFAFVVTCGREVYDASPAQGDILHEFWWDAVMAELLFAAHRRLTDHLTARYRLGKTTTMSPGSGDLNVWPIEQQRDLFRLMGDVRGAIGVELTDSCLMIPNKTISGVRFAAEVEFRACQVCRRDPCPSRSAPFDHALWEEMELA
ncbi:MAG: vitamin B12 dependent methionine synthase [Armatimonadetes bacterium]|nr:vitamin B12 dependent methionine synthase [Armatimonadota bacterium]